MGEINIGTVLDKVQSFSKLTIDEQIFYMKFKGITFNYINEEDAKKLLTNNTYYYKVTAFRKNFPKLNNKYTSVDFGTLNDLATIDMYVRYISIKLLLDIEHTLKSELINVITEANNEDGYSIVSEFEDYIKAQLVKNKPDFKPEKYKNISKKIMNRNKNQNGYHYDIYLKRKINPPIWVLLELMSFGELIKFIEFYYEENKYKKKVFQQAYDLLKYTKNFRDSSAHSRPLILNLTKYNEFLPGPKITIFASKASIKKSDRKKYFSNIKIHDFTCILILHDHYIKTIEIKNDRKKELERLKKRCFKRRVYYRNQKEMKDILKIYCKIVDRYNSL